MITQNFLRNIETKLRKEKVSIENSLKSFAKKDKNLKGDWDTRFPNLNGGSLEDSADAVEQYESALPVEFSLENKLKNIDEALEKIKQGKYGNCENCKKPIPQKRLEALPEAKLCGECLE